MLFYPLLLGALAISFPFLSLVGMMIFSGRAALQGIDVPIRVIAAFFLAPAALMLWDHSGMLIPALDAILGVRTCRPDLPWALPLSTVHLGAGDHHVC